SVPLGERAEEFWFVAGAWLEERDQPRELRPPPQRPEDVAPPPEHDPADLGTPGAVQAFELRSSERVDAALARLVRDAVVDGWRRRVGPGDRSQAHGREW